MNYIEILNDDELKFLCSNIHIKIVREYFNKNSKNFQKIKPGFRANTLTKDEIFSILYDNYSDPFISEIINLFISKELEKIDSIANKLEGTNNEFNLIFALSRSIFIRNINLYFKLAQKDVSQEHMNILSDLAKDISDLISDNTEFLNKLQIANKEIKKLESKNDKKNSTIEKLNEKLEQYTNIEKENKKNIIEIEELKKKDIESNKKLEEYISLQKSSKATIENLKSRLNTLEKDLEKSISEEEHLNTIKNLKSDYDHKLDEKYTEIQNLKIERSNLEKEIITWKERFNMENFIDDELLYPLRPKSMEEFEEFFEYNVESLGISTSETTYKLLFKYIKSIAFLGSPILIKYRAGMNLANILSNTLEDKKFVRSINIDKDTKLYEINHFLKSTNDRVVVINNLIGSGREFEVLPMLLTNENKIIIVTYLHDRTLYYLPQETLEYFNYVNLSSYKILSNELYLEEDGSKIEEEEYIYDKDLILDNNRYTRIFDRITNELGFGLNFSSRIGVHIDDIDKLDSILLFSILPFVRDVLKINPYEKSIELQKYAGRDSKSKNKSIYLEWFDL